MEMKVKKKAKMSQEKEEENSDYYVSYYIERYYINEQCDNELEQQIAFRDHEIIKLQTKRAIK